MADKPDCYSNPAKSVTSLTQAAINQALNEVSQECTLPEDDGLKGLGGKSVQSVQSVQSGIKIQDGEDECVIRSPSTGTCISVPRLPRTGSSPYHSTPSLDEFEDGINGMRRELSEQTIHINVQPSEEYLESHQFDGTQMVASLSRLYTEDEDEHYSGRPIPTLSIGQRKCNRYQFNVNSPPLSIASSTTDFGELFNDSKRLPDCHSCDVGFTDDEIAGKWKIHSIEESICDDSEEDPCSAVSSEHLSNHAPTIKKCSQASQQKSSSQVKNVCVPKPNKDNRDVAKCYKERNPDDYELICKKERRSKRRQRTAKGEQVSDDDLNFTCRRTAGGVNPSSRQPGSTLRVSRKQRDEREEREEERHDRRSSRRKSRSRKEEEEEKEKKDSVEGDRRSRRRASQRRKREEEAAQETCDGNERRRRRKSRDNKEERKGCCMENEVRRSRRRSTSQYAVDESEIEENERRYGGRKSLNRLKEASKGESFLKSLKEAKNICFFKNPYFEEQFENVGDHMLMSKVSRGSKKNSGFYCDSSADEQLGRNAKGSAQKMSSSKNSSLRKNSNQSVNYIHQNFAHAMQHQMQNQLHFPPFSAQPNMQGYKQSFINTVYSPLKPISSRKRVDA